ncbi:MAG: radical SAM protein [Candidatus Aminicenantes bacterium]|nr:radical SAM protein [Candidatus Aminicenantes bacterium]
MSCLTEEKTEANAAEMRALDLPEGVPPLHSLYMYIAGSCNLACRHCWIEPDFSPDQSKGKFLRPEWAKKAVVEAKPLGLQSVKLTGGEPLFHPQFREIVSAIAQEGVDIIIETNGTLIDDDLAGFLRDAGRVRFISVSVDGAKVETHEALRGVAGSFDKAVSGIQTLVKAGFRPQLICTLHRNNIGEIAEVIALAEGVGCSSVKFNHIQRTGRGSRMHEEKHGLSVGEIIRTYQRLESEFVPRARVKVFFDIPIAFYSIRKIINGNPGRCNVLNLLGVLSGGELSLCGVGVLVPELIYGHLSSDNLKEVWKEAPGLKELRRLIPAELEGICGRCLFKDTCLGQCVANNYYAAKILNFPYYFCRLADEKGLFPSSRRK